MGEKVGTGRARKSLLSGIFAHARSDYVKRGGLCKMVSKRRSREEKTSTQKGRIPDPIRTSIEGLTRERGRRKIKERGDMVSQRSLKSGKREEGRRVACRRMKWALLVGKTRLGNGRGGKNEEGGLVRGSGVVLDETPFWSFKKGEARS